MIWVPTPLCAGGQNQVSCTSCRLTVHSMLGVVRTMILKARTADKINIDMLLLAPHSKGKHHNTDYICDTETLSGNRKMSVILK
jgi:hypothetical protein